MLCPSCYAEHADARCPGCGAPGVAPPSEPLPPPRPGPTPKLTPDPDDVCANKHGGVATSVEAFAKGKASSERWMEIAYEWVREQTFRPTGLAPGEIGSTADEANNDVRAGATKYDSTMAARFSNLKKDGLIHTHYTEGGKAVRRATRSGGTAFVRVVTEDVPYAVAKAHSEGRELGPATMERAALEDF